VSLPRRSSLYALALVLTAAGLPGCGGGGGGGGTVPGPPVQTATPTPSPTPLPGSSAFSFTVSPGAGATGSFGPVTGGYTGTVTLPAASASSTLSGSFFPGSAPPAGTPTIQNLQRRPRNIGAANIAAIAFVTVTPTAGVTFPKTPDFTFVAPFNVATLGGFAYVAEYDPTNPGAGWTTIEGPAAASGNTLSFAGAPPPLALAAGKAYVFMLFTVPSALPTPSPTPSPTPTVGSTPTATPTATPTPAAGQLPNCSPLAPQTTGSTYTLQSNPSGITVQRVDASITPTCANFTGVTTASEIPQTAPHAWNYIFAPGQASPYVVTVAQQLDGNHTIFYNQAGDSSGAIDATSLQSIRRAASSVPRTARETQRGIRRFSGPGVVSSQVLVRFGGRAA